ncbi:unnamed protein product [Owenia fusiformis]|uniref:Uncharacterized protein n=1 Tax=Owenia fusiformis TaxID=6347 RepID=A0A8J1XWX0_OWEFU|nr:unnamed protein product [Owenia fusiformis]
MEMSVPMLTFISCMLIQLSLINADPYLPYNRPEGKARPIRSCGGKPADIVFTLDSSSSIWGPDYRKQIEFVQDMAGSFQIGPDMTRIGVSQFSDRVHLLFRLKDYKNVDDVQTALYYTRRRYGGTNTAAALRHMGNRMFSNSYGGRGGDVPRIAVVITDGISSDRKKTVLEAKQLHQKGVTVFAIGVGANINKKELEAIASDPDEQYVYTVDNYDALDTIKNMLAMKACEVKEPTTPPPPADQPCGARQPADIVFALGADNSNTENRNSALDFINKVIKDMEVGNDNIQVGMVPKDCSSLSGFTPSDFNTKDQIKNGLDSNKASPAKSGSALEYMRKTSFTEEGGCRMEVKKIGVVIIDGTTEDLDKIATEAKRLRENDIEMFAIGVGKDIDESILRLIASEPSMRHIYTAGDYADLQFMRSDFLDVVCNGL